MAERQQQPAELDDCRWLIANQAAGWLHKLSEDSRPLVALTASLRATLSPARMHLLLEQVALRRRAREKFASAERMFFTRVGLEQASDEWVAAYKAGRFPAGEPVADLCCGIGGDLLSLAVQRSAAATDRHPATALFAEANCRAAGHHHVQVRTDDAADFDLSAWAAWHIDPDRRAHGRRSTRVDEYEPGPAAIERLLTQCGHAAVKLAPAARVPAEWSSQAELEWISRGRECRQLVAWFGRLAQAPGRRRATVLERWGGVRTLIGDGGKSAPHAAGIGRYVFEPDPAVLAAGLTGELAAELELACLTPGIAYLTGDKPLADAAAACFEVTDVEPLAIKRLKALFRSRHVGTLEVKKRGVPHDPEVLRRQLVSAGDQSATLIVTRLGGKVTAIVARRVEAGGDVPRL